MKPLRVLQFITPSGFYGAERWVLAMANNTNTSEMICDLAVTQESATQDLTVAQLYPRDKGEVHYLPMSGRFDFSVVDKLVDVIKRRNIDVLHTHGYKSDILGVLAAKKAGIKIVATPHGFSNNIPLKLRLFIKLGLFAIRFADKVAPLSQQLITDIVKAGIRQQNIQFIENGVDLTELEMHRKEFPLAATSLNAPHFGYIGQLIARKGIADMIQAFNLVFSRYPQAKLTLIGDGDQRAELEALAASLPCSAAIEFLGFRQDRLQLSTKFDIFLMTSSLEGIPRCLMEAMIVGTPVVAYDIPGVDQLINHELTGLLAPLGNWQQFAEQCIHLIEQPDLYNRVAVTGRQLVDQRFSAKRMTDEYVQLFRQLLASESR
jgi:glycosyltransferase involved in cell wall biosynthesis